MTVADKAVRKSSRTALLTGYVLQIPGEKTRRYEVWMKPMRSSELIAAVERCIEAAGAN